MRSAEQPPGERPAGLLAEIERFEREGVCVVAVAGELDVSNVGALERTVSELSNEALGVVLDLSSTTYIDSATIGFLFKLHRDLDRRGQALRLVCSPNAQRVLQLTGLDRELPPEEDRDVAVAAIQRDVPLGERI